MRREPVLHHPGEDDEGPVGPTGNVTSKIKALDQKLAGGHAELVWKRAPNTTGYGAVHMKSFHSKLNAESLHYLDQQINEWLDAHPDVEVKFSTSTVGEWVGKVKEPNLIIQIWV